MTDPAAHDPWLRALAWAHPIWMSLSITCALLALRSGLALRRARLRRERRRPEDLRRHLSRAKPALVMLLAGFAAGPASMWWLRGRVPFGSAHALAGVTAIALLLAAAWLGRRLERGRGRPVDAHALLALLAVLAAGIAAATGLVLLP